MKRREPPTPGAFFEGRYPFFREKVSLPPDDPEGGYRETETWRPGTYSEVCGHGYDGEPCTHTVADGIGTIILTVVSVHRPGTYPTRVFFTRRWRDPDGKEFGKTKLHIAVASKFYALSRGYRHDYEMSKANGAKPEKEKLL